MSGSVGASRIKREDVKPTVDLYTENILEGFEGYVSSEISGSYNTSSKESFGDIDLILLVKGYPDKKTAKLAFKQYIEDSDKTLPFRGDNKHKGKYTNNTGEIITINYVQSNFEDDVQIDNIFALSEDELDFKLNFLNMPAEEQGLLLGLSKVIISENPKMFNGENYSLNNNQVFEYNLSSYGLEVRLATLDENFKTIDKKIIWSTTKWSELKQLFKKYYVFDKDFDYNLEHINNTVIEPNNKNRIVGVFKSMITIKSGELDTPKGDNKQQKLEEVEKVLSTKIISIFPGRFQPFGPHHLEVYKIAKKKYGQVYIATSDKVVLPESPFSFNQKRDIMDITGVLPKDIVQTRIPYNPKEIYETLDDDVKVIFIIGKKNSDRLKGDFFTDVSNLFTDDRYKEKGAYIDSSIEILEDGEPISSTVTRDLIASNDIESVEKIMGEEVTQYLIDNNFLNK